MAWLTTVDVQDCVDVLVQPDHVNNMYDIDNARIVPVEEGEGALGGRVTHSDTDYSNMTDSPALRDRTTHFVNNGKRKSASSADLLNISKFLNGNSSGFVEVTPSSLDERPDLIFKYQDSKKLKKRPYKERRFHRLFRNVPLTEVLISRFSCAYIGDMGLLLQGHLYCSDSWICFHSNVFGIEKIIEIPMSTVACVTKERTAKIIPNAVGIRTHRRKQYAFGSLLSRDSTYQLLLRLLDAAQTPASSRSIQQAEEFDTELQIDDQKRPLVGDFDDDEAYESSDESSSDSSFYPTQRTFSPTPARDTKCPKFSVKYCYSRLTQLPALVLILLVCIFLVFCTLLCTGYMALRVMYRQQNTHPILPPVTDETGRVWTGKIQSMIDSTLENLQQVRQHLYRLKLEASSSGSK